MTKNTLTFFLLLTNAAIVFCQKSMNTSGGNITTSSGTISYSVGQTTSSFISSDKGSIVLGVQSPFEITTTLGIDNTNIVLEMSSYPNPTTDFLHLSIKNNVFKDLKFVLYDLLGKQQQQNNISTQKTVIDMRNLPNTIYLLKIVKNNKPIKTFKIIKN